MTQVAIPENVSVKIQDNVIFVEGPLGKVSRKFDPRTIAFKIEKNSVDLSAPMRRKTSRTPSKVMVGTMTSHIRNMIAGVTKGWEYRLKIIYLHFPITVKVEGSKILINNFVGERSPRVTALIGGAKIEVKGDEITVKGIDLEEVSKTAANIENVTKIKNYDRRVFQDGIYITKGKKG
ncbi:MAG: 50S ribosomal protein L6 [Candidatus Aenigmatarchaeota archaeon]